MTYVLLQLVTSFSFWDGLFLIMYASQINKHFFYFNYSEGDGKKFY